MKTFANPTRQGPMGSTHQRPSPVWRSHQPNVAKLARANSPQPKLTVGAPNDRFEQEAEHVADAIMRMPDPRLQRACSCGGTCADCEQEEETLGLSSIQRASTDGSPFPDVPGGVDEVQKAPGQPLPSPTRAFMESRFGEDFGQVRVHTGSSASESAQDLHARAYTIGRDIAFAPGEFSPDTQEGQHLLAHELTHVIQQGGNSGPIQRAAFGAGTHRTTGGNTMREATNEEREGANGIDAALRLVQSIVDRGDARGRVCRQWFVDNCDPGRTLADLNREGIIWVWRIADGSSGNGLTDGGATQNHAVTEQLLNVKSRWALAATIIHEYWHNCQNNAGADIGDDAKAACGLPNI